MNAAVLSLVDPLANPCQRDHGAIHLRLLLKHAIERSDSPMDKVEARAGAGDDARPASSLLRLFPFARRILRGLAHPLRRNLTPRRGDVAYHALASRSCEVVATKPPQCPYCGRSNPSFVTMLP
jgi:hypothetical protein